MSLWSFISLSIIACFAGRILCLIIIGEHKNINSIQELIESDMSIQVYNKSWLWHQFNNKKEWSNTLDDSLAKIESRINFSTSKELNIKVKFSQLYTCPFE